MADIKSIQTYDEDLIETVRTFKVRKGLATYSEALEKLVGRAKEHGLHKRDIEPGMLEQPRQAAGSTH